MLIKASPCLASATVIRPEVAGTRYLSMAFQNSAGGASSNGVTTATSASAKITRHLYGAMYCTSRFIKRNRTPCLTPLLHEYCSCAFELFFQQLFLVQIRVISLAGQQFVMRAPFDEFAVFQHH